MGLQMFMLKYPNYKNCKLTEIKTDMRMQNIKIKGNEWISVSSSLIEILIFWEQANAIHGWFVRNVMDDDSETNLFMVRQEQIQYLLEDCNTVLLDKSKAKKLLPPMRRAFFGSFDTDKWYYDAIKKTKKGCEEILDGFDFENDLLVYQVTW